MRASQKGYYKHGSGKSRLAKYCLQTTFIKSITIVFVYMRILTTHIAGCFTHNDKYLSCHVAPLPNR
jgi:hypothetical protein